MVKNTFRVLIYGFLLANLVSLTSISSSHYLKELSIRNSYIAGIHLEKHKHSFVRTSLGMFSAYSKKLVNTDGLRPIYVFEVDFDSNSIGMAVPFLNSCFILIDSNLSKRQFISVFAHEWLHCHFYEHTADPKDLMYPSEIKSLDIKSSVRYYSRELYQKGGFEDE